MRKWYTLSYYTSASERDFIGLVLISMPARILPYIKDIYRPIYINIRQYAIVAAKYQLSTISLPKYYLHIFIYNINNHSIPVVTRWLSASRIIFHVVYIYEKIGLQSPTMTIAACVVHFAIIVDRR